MGIKELKFLCEAYRTMKGELEELIIEEEKAGNSTDKYLNRSQNRLLGQYLNKYQRELEKATRLEKLAEQENIESEEEIETRKQTNEQTNEQTKVEDYLPVKNELPSETVNFTTDSSTFSIHHLFGFS